MTDDEIIEAALRINRKREMEDTLRRVREHSGVVYAQIIFNGSVGGTGRLTELANIRVNPNLALALAKENKDYRP